MENICDFDLVKKIQEEKKHEDYLILFERYFPLIKSFIFKFCRRFPSNSETKYDYKQDAFLSMVKAIDSVKFDKITKEREKWQFKGTFFNYLKNQDKDYRKKCFRNINNSSDFLEEDLSPVQLGICFKIDKEEHKVETKKYFYKIINKDNNLENSLTYFCLNESIKEIATDRQKRIIGLRMEGQTFKEVSKILGIPFTTVMYQMRNLGKKLSETFDLNMDLGIRNFKEWNDWKHKDISIS
jgi:RNA polymerase sigma factor (sigma-70 family)